MRSLVSLPFRPVTPPPWYGSLGYLTTVVAVGVATGVLQLMLPLLSVAGIYLVYLVVVVLVSVGWGVKQGILASVLSFLAANFFFTQPIFSLAVTAVQDIIALVTFLGLAILTSQLVSRLRWEAQEARRNQQITATLYALGQTLNRQRDLPMLLDEVTYQLCSALNLSAATIALQPMEGYGAITAHSGPVLENSSSSFSNIVSNPLFAGGHQIGVLLLQLPTDGKHLTNEEQSIVAAFSEQLQVAIERAQLQHTAIQTVVLRRTDALRAALLSAVAHDLRTPLTSIKSAASSLLSPPKNDWAVADQKHFLTDIIEEVDRIERLVSNLLDVSRIEAGRLQPHKELYRIGELVQTVVERLSPILKDHPLAVSIAPNLPPVPMDVIQTDEILTNLLENAVKYTPRGTPLDISARQSNKAIEVAVADRGPGIPADHITQLFSRFYRVTAGSAGAGGAKGTGLGLAIVKGIVEAHGGEVSAANRPGGGATFKFTLPLDADSDDTGSPANIPTEDAAAFRHKPKRRQLDEPETIHSDS